MLPQPLPRTLFEEIGKIVVIWASIEQNIMMQTSAMAAMKVDGKTTDYLRLDFTRLRKIWLPLCRENFNTVTFNTVVNPLNSEMARLAEQRGLIVHGTWTHTGRGKFKLSWYEQKTHLTHFENENVTLGTVREIRHDSFLLSKRVYDFTWGADGSHKGARAFLKTVPAVVPSDEG